MQHQYPLKAAKTRPTNTETYLQSMGWLIGDLSAEIKKAKEDGKTPFIFYNAGTDPLDGDPVAWLGVSEQGIIDRDYMVWKCAHDNHVPIVMTLSGGYSYKSAAVIADSITNILINVWGYQQIEQPTSAPKLSMWPSWLFFWRK
jgi:acetoin utilization deacetylase AcuC-like enzyme